MDKKTIAVVFGGQSSEHEISCISVATVLRQIDESKYNILIIGITKEGRWLKVDSIEAVEDGSWREGTVGAILSPDASMKGVLFLENGHATLEKVDVVFPVLHGLWGEDGTIQGVLELAVSPMWAAEFWLLLSPWISCIRRLLWIPSVWHRRHTFRCCAES